MYSQQEVPPREQYSLTPQNFCCLIGDKRVTIIMSQIQEFGKQQSAEFNTENSSLLKNRIKLEPDDSLYNNLQKPPPLISFDGLQIINVDSMNKTSESVVARSKDEKVEESFHVEGANDATAMVIAIVLVNEEKHIIKDEPQDMVLVLKEEVADIELRNEVLSSNSNKPIDDEVDYFCSHCDYKTDCGTDFYAHYKTTHNYQSVVYCGRCEFETTLKSYLIDHSHYCKHVEHVQVFKCVHCPYETNIENNLLKHRATHDVTHKQNEEKENNNRSEKYKCPECPYEYTRKIYLRYHMMTKHDNNNSSIDNRKKVEETEVYECDKCPFKTKIKESLSSHSHTHSSEVEKYRSTSGKQNVWIYKCAQCPYESKWQYDIDCHCSRAHKQKTEWNHCVTCDYRTKNKERMSRHSLTHTTEEKQKMYRCSDCSYEDTQKANLQDHIKRRHNTNKDSSIYTCP